MSFICVLKLAVIFVHWATPSLCKLKTEFLPRPNTIPLQTRNWVFATPRCHPFANSKLSFCHPWNLISWFAVRKNAMTPEVQYFHHRNETVFVRSWHWFWICPEASPIWEILLASLATRVTCQQGVVVVWFWLWACLLLATATHY